MSTKPHALMLADWIADQWAYEKMGLMTQEQVSEVIEELRAQHELIQTLTAAVTTLLPMACSDIERWTSAASEGFDEIKHARAALAAVEAHK